MELVFLLEQQRNSKILTDFNQLYWSLEMLCFSFISFWEQISTGKRPGGEKNTFIKTMRIHKMVQARTATQ